ncbi:flagellar hook-basal body protein [Bacillus sp. CGMCC 1.16607]|uniref:flagellar hook-basal body protein n=1 Tax=Bacillus sp. CGMCC 1.16607 TaxID=3351842 RepID=UPI00363B3CCC
MNRSMITATNTLAQLQKQMDIISNNMANVDTNGFKRREVQFTDLLVHEFQNQRKADAETNRLTPNFIRQGTGAKLGQVQLNMTQGSIKPTERSLDTAFTKEGQFYRVLVQNENESEIQYTRNGALYLSPISDTELMLVNADGHPILDENNQQIIVSGDAKDFTITENGSFFAKSPNGREQSYNLGVVQVNKPQFLEQKGNNLLGLPANFAELGVTVDEILTALNGPQRGQIGINQRALEQSNVDMSKEMTQLMNVQRSYQFQARSITISDQMMGLVNGIR